MESSSNEPENEGSDAHMKVFLELMRIGSVPTLEDMDMEVLKFQNKKLAMRLADKKRIENELRQRIEQLEERQTQDDAVLKVITRYWNQFNEDVGLMLQRFDAGSAHDLGARSESEAAFSFVMQLSTWNEDELDEKLANRVQVSKLAVAKIVLVYDRLLLKYEKVLNFLESLSEFSFADSNLANMSVDKLIEKSAAENKDDEKDMDESNEDSKNDANPNGSNSTKQLSDDETDNSNGEKVKNQHPTAIIQHLKEMYTNSSRDNIHLHQTITVLQEKQHIMSLKLHELQRTLNKRELEIAELRNRIDDVECENSKLRTRTRRIKHYLAETLENMRADELAFADRSSTASTASTDAVARTTVSNEKETRNLVEETSIPRGLESVDRRVVQETRSKNPETADQGDSKIMAAEKVPSFVECSSDSHVNSDMVAGDQEGPFPDNLAAVGEYYEIPQDSPPDVSSLEGRMEALLQEGLTLHWAKTIELLQSSLLRVYPFIRNHLSVKDWSLKKKQEELLWEEMPLAEQTAVRTLIRLWQKLTPYEQRQVVQLSKNRQIKGKPQLMDNDDDLSKNRRIKWKGKTEPMDNDDDMKKRNPEQENRDRFRVGKYKLRRMPDFSLLTVMMEKLETRENCEVWRWFDETTKMHFLRNMIKVGMLKVIRWSLEARVYLIKTVDLFRVIQTLAPARVPKATTSLVKK